MAKDLLVNINIPFCINRCSYCTLPIHCVSNLQLKRQYMEALAREFEAIREELAEEYTLRAVYISGGTPTLADHAQLKELILGIRRGLPLSENLEISMETVPGSIGIDPFSSYRKAGIGRFDLGVCTTHPIEWESLERPHNYQSMYNSCLIMQFAQFHEYGMDLLYGLPGQSPKTLVDSMDECLEYCPPHMSLYPLLLQSGSRLHACFVEGREDTGVARNRRELPTEEARFAMYRQGRAHLLEKGYQQYTLYHFAKPGHACKYRALCCEDLDIIGLGLGAESYTGGFLVNNTSSLEAYIAGAGDMEKITARAVALDEASRMNRALAKGLSAGAGISAGAFKARFGREIGAVYGARLDALAAAGRLEWAGDALRLTERGAFEAAAVFKALEGTESPQL